MIPGQVSRRLECRACDPVGVFGHETVFLRLHWTHTDPLALNVNVDVAPWTSWTTTRDVLAEGLDVETGMGAVSVRPALAPRRVVLDLPGHPLVASARGPLVAFLAATERIVPRGVERLDLDRLCAQLIGQS